MSGDVQLLTDEAKQRPDPVSYVSKHFSFQTCGSLARSISTVSLALHGLLKNGFEIFLARSYNESTPHRL